MKRCRLRCASVAARVAPWAGSRSRRRVLKRKGHALRFCGKTFRVFEAARLEGAKWAKAVSRRMRWGTGGCVLPVEQAVQQRPAAEESVGIDLGLKDIAVTSDGETSASGPVLSGPGRPDCSSPALRSPRPGEAITSHGCAPPSGCAPQIQPPDGGSYETIVVGDVSSQKLVRTRIAKSVLDSGWSMLKQMLQYKGEYAGRSVEVVSERNTTRACSVCGALLGPAGMDMLAVRHWDCPECGAGHDRDMNAARNILFVGLRSRASVRGERVCGMTCSPSSRTERTVPS